MLLFLQNIFRTLNVRFFWLKIRKILKLDRLEMKKEYFDEKKLSSVKKASVPKWRGRKYAGDNRPFYHHSFFEGLLKINWPSFINYYSFACLLITTYRPSYSRIKNCSEYGEVKTNRGHFLSYLNISSNNNVSITFQPLLLEGTIITDNSTLLWWVKLILTEN